MLFKKEKNQLWLSWSHSCGSFGEGKKGEKIPGA